MKGGKASPRLVYDEHGSKCKISKKKFNKLRELLWNPKPLFSLSRNVIILKALVPSEPIPDQPIDGG